MIRSGTKRRLVAVMGHVLPEVNVAYTWAGANAADSTPRLGETLGALEPEPIGTAKPQRAGWTLPGAMVPFGLHQPMAVRDPDFDLDFHLREAWVEPGQTLDELFSRLA